MAKALKKQVNTEIGKRLRELRKGHKLSLNKIVKQLASHVNIQLEGKSGETRISAIENSTGNLTLELAIAYSKIFDVSLEYILCLSNDMQPENKTVKEVLGLTDIAISKIKGCTDKNRPLAQMQILNFLFESDFMMELVRSLDSFIYTSNFYNNCETLSFDSRQEDDTEVVKLIPRWRLDKSVSASIERIVNLLQNDDKLKEITPSINSE